MPKSSSRKRPCSICRKWFLPDVRQKGRQKTCDNPDCRREYHRRQCADWNKKNKEYFKGNYLNAKLEKVANPSPDPCTPPQPGIRPILMPECRMRPIIPRDIALREVGARKLIIIEYLAEQLMQRKAVNATGFS